MSVVVVVKKDQKIVIASDTLTTINGYIGINSTHKSNSEKMVKYKDSWIGSVGASMSKQMLLHALQSSITELSLHGVDNIYRTMLKIHKVLKKDHYLSPHKTSSNHVESSQITLLIANSSGIFGVSADRYVADYSKFWANGSGRNYALGAMEQAYHTHSAEEIAEIGVKAACEFDKHCELPLNIHTIQEDLFKDKIKVSEPIAKSLICDTWCKYIYGLVNYIKEKIQKFMQR